LYAADGAGRPPAGYIHRSSDVAVVGQQTLPLSAWSHLALTYDGANLRLFVNGVQVGSKAQTGSIPTPTSALRIGGASVWGEFFTGLIDEVRVYSTALSSPQILADMNTPINGTPADTTPPTATLTAPAGGSTVSGTSVSVAATATDN